MESGFFQGKKSLNGRKAQTRSIFQFRRGKDEICAVASTKRFPAEEGPPRGQEFFVRCPVGLKGLQRGKKIET